MIFRSDRFFCVNSRWYFHTRERAVIGPFDTKVEAQHALIDFIDFVEKAEPSLVTAFLNHIRSDSSAG